MGVKTPPLPSRMREPIPLAHDPRVTLSTAESRNLAAPRSTPLNPITVRHSPPLTALPFPRRGVPRGRPPPYPTHCRAPSYTFPCHSEAPRGISPPHTQHPSTHSSTRPTPSKEAPSQTGLRNPTLSSPSPHPAAPEPRSYALPSYIDPYS